MEQGYFKRTITFIIPSQAGDKFLNRNDWDFITGRGSYSGGEIMIVEEKIKSKEDEKRDKTNW